MPQTYTAKTVYLHGFLVSVASQDTAILRSVPAAICEPQRGADRAARATVRNLPRYSDRARFDMGFGFTQNMNFRFF